MSDFTTQLRFICESYAEKNKGYDAVKQMDIDTIIENSREDIFNFDYPIFDEEYKPELEKKIINHFYTQEIGQETVGLFKQRLKTKMREIMPYYNQFYMSERLKFDPFKNADYIDLHNTQDEGSKTGTNDNTSGFSNSTLNDIDNTHHDSTADTSSGTNHKDGNSNDTKNDTGTESSAANSTTDLKHGLKVNDSIEKTDTGVSNSLTNLEKIGSEMHSTTPPAAISTITKEADTPLGSIGDGAGAAASAVAGNSGYLSKVTEVITNATSTENARKNGWDSTRYGKYFGTKNGNEGVHDEDRRDVTDTAATTSTIGAETAEHTNSGTDTTEVEATDSKVKTNAEVGTNEFQEDGSHTEVGNSDTVGGYHTDNDTTSTGVSNSNTIDTQETKNKQDYFGKVFGKVGSETYSEMLNKFRSTFLNIDMDVIHELEPLFMLIW